MKRIVTTMLTVLLTAQLAVAQCGPFGCPDGNCPAPQLQGGDYWSPRGPSMGMIREQPIQTPRRQAQAPVSTTTPPEWLCHVYGASGMLIYKDAKCGVVLTAYHVIKGGPRSGIEIQFPDGKRYLGRVYEAASEISADKLYDAACIAIATPDASPVSMATMKPSVGTQTWIVGYGSGRYQVRSARVAAYMNGTWRGAGSEPGTMHLRGDRSAVGGDSGGALINSAGELVGVISTSDRDQVTNGPSLARIYALCSDERFHWPWRDDIQKFGQDIGRLQEEKADRAEIPLPPPPDGGVKLPPAPGLDEDAVKRVVEQERAKDAYGLAGEIDENRKRLEKLEAWNPLLEELKAAKAKLLAMDPDKLRTDLGREVQSDLKANLAKAEEAANAVARATDAIKPAAEAAAKTAVEAAAPGLFDRVKALLPEGIATRVDAAHKAAAGLRAWVFGSYGGLVLLGVVVLWIVLDVKHYIKSGGEDKLTIQKIADRLERITERTRNPYDDYIGGGAQAGANQLAALVELLSGMNRGKQPQPPVQPAPAPAQPSK